MDPKIRIDRSSMVLDTQCHLRFAATALAAPFLLAAFGAAAIEPQSVNLRTEDTTTFVWENDSFMPGPRTDRWYTNGLHLAKNYRPGSEPLSMEEVHKVGRFLFGRSAGCPDERVTTLRSECAIRVTYGLGQNMYTPRLITNPNAQRFDRPWAGWLYFGAGLINQSENRVQVAAYKMGPTGPASGAEDVQVAWHRLWHFDHPAGWDNQLRPMLGVQVSYLSSHLFKVGDSENLGIQLSWGGMFGNLRRVGRVGAAIVWSPTGNSGDLLAGSLDEGEFLVPEARGRSEDASLAGSFRRGVYFAHIQISAVAHNEFLTGRTFGARPQIVPIAGVYTTTVGLAVPIGDSGSHRIGWSFKVRSPEFRAIRAPQRDAYQRWAAITYSHYF